MTAEQTQVENYTIATAQTQPDIAKEWKESGLSQSDFAKARGMSIWTLRTQLYRGRYNRKCCQEKKGRSRTNQRQKFLPVQIITGNSIHLGIVEIQLRNGRVVRFHQDIEPETLQELLLVIDDRK